MPPSSFSRVARKQAVIIALLARQDSPTSACCRTITVSRFEELAHELQEVPVAELRGAREQRPRRHREAVRLDERARAEQVAPLDKECKQLRAGGRAQTVEHVEGVVEGRGHRLVASHGCARMQAGGRQAGGQAGQGGEGKGGGKTVS